MHDTTDDERDINPLDLHDSDFDLTQATKPTALPENTFDPFAPLHTKPAEAQTLPQG